MLHHVSIGVADVARAARFYDAVLDTLGYKRVMEFLPYAIAYGERSPVFWVSMPADQQAPSPGNGAHIAFNASSQKAVHAFHEAALGAGAKDEGGPGPRPEYSPNYYGAFVRDPDGNKIEAVFFAMEAEEQPAKAKRSKARKTTTAKKASAKRGAPAKKTARRPAGRKTPSRRGTRAKKR